MDGHIGDSDESGLGVGDEVHTAGVSPWVTCAAAPAADVRKSTHSLRSAEASGPRRRELPPWTCCWPQLLVWSSSVTKRASCRSSGPPPSSASIGRRKTGAAGSTVSCSRHGRRASSQTVSRSSVACSLPLPPPKRSGYVHGTQRLSPREGRGAGGGGGSRQPMSPRSSAVRGRPPRCNAYMGTTALRVTGSAQCGSGLL